MRALILVRLSRVTDATTSPERQEAACRRYCEAHGLPVVAVVWDLDVSGATDPMRRDGIGPWLRDRLAEFDVIVAVKLDRVGRSAQQISALMAYLLEHGKNLRTVSDQIEIGTPVGRLIVYALATAAELELAAISDRNTGASQHNLRAGKWSGGTLPAGYRPVRAEDGPGWRLVPDEDGLAPVIREVVGRVLSGDRLAGIVADLNRRGVQTAKDRQAVLTGREPTGRRWSLSNLRRMLESPAVIGQVTERPVVLDSDGRPVRDGSGGKVYGPERVLFGEDGAPVRRGEPLVPESDFRALRQLLDERRAAEPGQRRSESGSLLTRVLYCGHCGEPMWRLRGSPMKSGKRRPDRYRCASTAHGKACGSGSVKVDEADHVVSETVRITLEGFPHVVREYWAGSDPAGELAEVDAQLQSLSEAVSRFPVGSPALVSLLERVDALSARREALGAEPVTESGWSYVATGRTAAEHFESLSVERRNDWMREQKFRAWYTRLPGDVPRWHFEAGDYPGMIEAMAPGLIAGIEPGSQ